MWSGNHVGHDSRIGSHCFLTSHVVVSGYVEIGERSFIGVNSTVRDGEKVGVGCIVGAGSLSLSDLPDGSFCIERGTKPLPMDSGEFLASGFSI
jgi:acetyltransferase-like isoleucine patch superfamily enzyme